MRKGFSRILRTVYNYACFPLKLESKRTKATFHLYYFYFKKHIARLVPIQYHYLVMKLIIHATCCCIIIFRIIVYNLKL